MILIKSLTKSDLTLIERFWEPRLKQEAIVLPKSFIKSLGQDYLDMEKGDFKEVSMTFWGPGYWVQLQKPEAKIHRQSKDWRLQECSIKAPQDLVERFGRLKPDGNTLFVFSVDPTGNNTSGKGLFVCADIEEDRNLHSALFEHKNSEISSEEFEQLLLGINLPENHAVNGFLGVADLGQDLHVIDDALQGGEAAVRGLHAQLSQADFNERKLEAERIGTKGEEIFDRWLASMPVIDGQPVRSHSWVAKTDVTSPFDFLIRFDEFELMAEVKTTSMSFGNRFYISAGELDNMVRVKTGLFRIANVDNDYAELRYTLDTADTAAWILKKAATLPEYVRAINFEVQPDRFGFGKAIRILSVAE